jgi:hypothetical protein
VAGGMLEGIRVIDLTSVVVGPLCTQILADHGAQVTKVESPQGDIGRYLGGRGRHVGMAPKFLHLNRNKRSICLDLKHPAGHAALLRLLADADVLVWNVRPDSMARLKLSYDDVRAVNPRLVYCGMFGFGQRGRYAGIAAYDPIIQGASGVAGLHEKAFGTPRYVPYVMADRTCGLIAVQMIVMALFHRERTGEGQSIEVPMFENMASQVLTEHLFNRTYIPPSVRRAIRACSTSSTRPRPRSTATSISRPIPTPRCLRCSKKSAALSSRPTRVFRRLPRVSRTPRSTTASGPRDCAGTPARIGSRCSGVATSRPRRITRSRLCLTIRTWPMSGCCASENTRPKAR